MPLLLISDGDRISQADCRHSCSPSVFMKTQESIIGTEYICYPYFIPQPTQGVINYKCWMHKHQNMFHCRRVLFSSEFYFTSFQVIWTTSRLKIGRHLTLDLWRVCEWFVESHMAWKRIQCNLAVVRHQDGVLMFFNLSLRVAVRYSRIMQYRTLLEFGITAATTASSQISHRLSISEMNWTSYSRNV